MHSPRHKCVIPGRGHRSLSLCTAWPVEGGWELGVTWQSWGKPRQGGLSGDKACCSRWEPGGGQGQPGQHSPPAPVLQPLEVEMFPTPLPSNPGEWNHVSPDHPGTCPRCSGPQPCRPALVPGF